MSVLDLKQLRTVELQSRVAPVAQQNIDEIVSMLQFGCDIVRATHGKLHEIRFHFSGQASLNLYDWDAEAAISEKVASLEEAILSTPSKPKVTISIPSLKPMHVTSIPGTARRLFSRINEAGKLFMSPTRE